MTDLSPATLTVWDRFCGIVEDHGPPRLGLAAALRAAADQVVPEFAHDDDDIYSETIQDVRYKLLAIAAELEALND